MPKILPRFDFKVDYAVAEDLGSSRGSFEDAHAVAEDVSLFVVADGLGGHNGGEIASRLATKIVAASFHSERTRATLEAYAAEPGVERRRRVFGRLRRAIERAHEALQLEVEAKPELAGMGTTLDVVCLLRNKAFIAHVGDGRVYLSRSHATLQLTQDHTDFDLQKARGELRHQARPKRHNRLASAVGLGKSITSDTVFVELGRGDRLLLCSDGVHGQIENESRLGELLRRGSASEAAGALVRAVTTHGRDNATALVIDIGEGFVKPPEGDAGLLASDLNAVRLSSLLNGLPEPALLAALAAAVEVEHKAGDSVPQAVANDLVAYIVLEGLIEMPDGRRVTTGALVFPESLAGVGGGEALPTVRQPTRLLRIRSDDFTEVCAADARLGVELYRRLAHVLARGAAAPASSADVRTAEAATQADVPIQSHRLKC